MLQRRLATVCAKVSLAHYSHHGAACHPAQLETVKSAADELAAFLFHAVVPGANPQAVTTLHLLSSACLSGSPKRSALTKLCGGLQCVVFWCVMLNSMTG